MPIGGGGLISGISSALRGLGIVEKNIWCQNLKVLMIPNQMVFLEI
jgi:Threonine dehydratase